jgi:imidazolonepropionase-like amidohydrolase
MATGGVMDPFSDFHAQELSEDQMSRAVEIAHRARRHGMADAEGTDGMTIHGSWRRNSQRSSAAG